MVAYWVARAKILDPVEYKKYTDRVPAILKKYNGRVLSRGGRQEQLEGPETFERHAIVEFDTVEDAVACHDSKEYQEAASFRLGGVGINELVILEGVEPSD